MIIKYYNNGWNYIDEVEDVKWINKTLEFDKNERVGVQGRIYISEGDFEILEERIRNDLEHQLAKYNKIQYGSLNVDIDYSEVTRLLRQGKDSYIRLIIYTKGESRSVLAFTHVGYLLNNNGQTIEKLG